MLLSLLGFGSIPALAGERVGVDLVKYVIRVYPRACGGTTFSMPTSETSWGLSPRLRGNAVNPALHTIFQGSIPALAGERPFFRHGCALRRVYPRACGGTVLSASSLPASSGLSPRLRGNGERHGRYGVEPGSIPALAGERIVASARRLVYRVYPRACGGTLFIKQRRNSQQGLSPRLRGNGVTPSSVTAKRGSIPALAGERQIRLICELADRVYPRACGGTRAPASIFFYRTGLSPRLRGNVRCLQSALLSYGSIPALAGERRLHVSGVGRYVVYPRACGGTAFWAASARVVPGLSPRLRGNDYLTIGSVGKKGSIPALAGERL